MFFVLKSRAKHISDLKVAKKKKKKRLCIKSVLVSQPSIQGDFLFWRRWRKRPRQPCLLCRMNF